MTACARVAVRAALAGCLAVFGSVACRKDSPPPTAETPPTPPPPPPESLIADGALGNVAATWASVRERIGGRALAVPSTFPLAVTTLIGASPLSAGLVDDRAPLALALVDERDGLAWVVGVKVTSGAELAASLSTGSEARFAAGPRTPSGLVPLVQKGAAVPLALGVAGDALVIASGRVALSDAGAYVGRTLLPSQKDRDGLSLTVPRSALSGVVAAGLRKQASAWIQALADADARTRKERGRDPDFGDPRAVTAALASAVTAVTDVIASCTEAKLDARFSGDVLDARVELVPAAVGRASELVRDAPIGDAALLGSAPEGVAFAALVHSEGASHGGSDFVRSVLGDRLRAADRARVEAFVDDLRAGLGTTSLFAVLDSGAVPTPFARGVGGEPARLGAAVRALPAVLRAPPFADLLSANGVPVSASLATPSVPGVTGLTGVRVEGARGAKTALPPVEVMASSVPAPVLAVGARGAVGPALAGLLAPTGPPLSADPTVARAVSRAAANTTAMLAIRTGRPPALTGFSTLTVGTDRRVLFADLAVSEAALRVGLPEILAPRAASP
ncbi:MAG TPA: hypothetical protein VHE30_08545 [Polyangiaceae bacterium]|nr:hypothetical protein [Polyangiaceae bacterium]